MKDEKSFFARPDFVSDDMQTICCFWLVSSEKYKKEKHNCGNSTTSMTDFLASIDAMGYHFENAINKEEVLELMEKRCK